MNFRTIDAEIIDQSEREPDMSSRALLELRSSNVTVSLRALILADTQHDAASIVTALKREGFDVNPTLVRTQQEFRAAIAKQDFDAVLADYRFHIVREILGTASIGDNPR